MPFLGKQPKFYHVFQPHYSTTLKYIDFLFVGGVVVSIVFFTTVIWSHHATYSLSNWNIGHCVTRPNNSCKGDYSGRGVDAFFFAQKYLDKRQETIDHKITV